MTLPHSHHAIQIVIALEGDMAISGARGEWRTGRGIIVRPDLVDEGVVALLEPSCPEDGAIVIRSQGHPGGKGLRDVARRR